MKKILIAGFALVLMLSAVVASARPFGMMGGVNATPEQQKFFDQTQDLRKQMHDKRFELMELSRNPNADSLKVADLENQINTIRAKIQEKAKEMNLAGNFGNCRNQQSFSCGNCPNNDGPQACDGPCGNGPQHQRGYGKMQGRAYCR